MQKTVKTMGKLRIIVGGMVGQYPLGGVAWDYFHYVLALHELGHEVYYHEDTGAWPHHPVKGYPTDDPNYTIHFIRDFFIKYAPESLRDNWHYVLLRDTHHGIDKEKWAEIERTADIFLNVSGASFIPQGLGERCLKVFMDTDPGYNQIVMYTKPEWSKGAAEWVKLVQGYDRHLTYAENMYADDCLIPKMDINWIPTRCVVTLDSWNEARSMKLPPTAPWTTVMSWGYFMGILEMNGVVYESKIVEFEKFQELPRHVKAPLLMAMNSWKAPVQQMRDIGWQMVGGVDVSATPEIYWKFITDSAGEWSVAKNVYVATRSGWFSCRTACYLAAGRPAVVQDTAWSRYVPSGAGVIAFNTMEETIAAMNEVTGNYEKHAQAAYEIAREYLAPDKVLPPMLEAILAEKTSHHVKSHLPPGVGNH